MLFCRGKLGESLNHRRLHENDFAARGPIRVVWIHTLIYCFAENSGPANHSKNTRSVGRDETPDFSEILLRLESGEED